MRRLLSLVQGAVRSLDCTSPLLDTDSNIAGCQLGNTIDLNWRPTGKRLVFTAPGQATFYVTFGWHGAGQICRVPWETARGPVSSKWYQGWGLGGLSASPLECDVQAYPGGINTSPMKGGMRQSRTEV